MHTWTHHHPPHHLHLEFSVSTQGHSTYKIATGDMNLSKVSPTQTKLTAYGGVTGSFLLRVLRGDFQHLTLVQEHTLWVNCMVVVPKKDGKLCICLDPRDLNKAIRREHYPLLTIDVGT